jgi:hypothetical protein
MPFTVEGEESVVTVVEALADKVSARRVRHVPFNLRVIKREDSIRVTVGGSVIQLTDDLDVLLRHGPLGISLSRPGRQCQSRNRVTSAFA